MPLLTYKQIGDIARSPAVRKKLAEVADRIARNAEGIAAAEGVDAKIVRSDGTRPRGRPFARVTADGIQEWGTNEVERRRVLGRAVQQSR